MLGGERVLLKATNSDHMGPLLVVLLFAVVLALGVVRLFRLPVHWTGYVVFALLAAGVYLYSLMDARANPWSLWKRSLMQDSGDAEQKRLARYVTQEECLKSQWKKLEEELEQQKQAHQAMKRMFPNMPKVHLLQGRTIFEFRPSLSSRIPDIHARTLGEFSDERKLTPHQEEQLAYEMRLPEVVSTVSVYCAPSLRYWFWPYYTPEYYAAADDLRRLGERTLSVKAKQMLGE